MKPPFAPFEIAHDAPQLSDAELEPRSSFEWWYFDLQTEDDVSMIVVFSRRNPAFSPSKASVFIQYKGPDTSVNRVRNYPRSQFSYVETGDVREIRVGPHSLRMSGSEPESMTYEIELDLASIELSLKLRPLHRGFLPSRDGAYFTHRDDPARRSCVSFSAPMMRGEGTATIGGRTRDLTGRGYHDHPWGTAFLFETHREWNWGRLRTPSGAIMFADVAPFPDFEGRLSFLFLGEPGAFEPEVSGELSVKSSLWKRDSWRGIRFPHAVAFSIPSRSWSASYLDSLLDTPIYTRYQVRLGSTDAEGQGWLEYYRMIGWLRPLILLGARLVCFVLRPFPFFGR